MVHRRGCHGFLSIFSSEIFIGQCKSHFYCLTKINFVLVLSFKLRTKIAEVEKKHIVLLVHLKFHHFQSLSEVQFKNDMQAL